MGKFGWAHISSAHKSARGPNKAVQFASGSEGFQSGSANFTYDYYGNILHVTGNVVVSGTLSANVFDVITTTKTEIEIGGNTNFGNDSADQHVFTGSVTILSGGLRQNYYRVMASSYSITTADTIIGVSGSAYTSLLLPSASVAGAGKIIIIKDEFHLTRTNATQIAVSASGTDKIDHQTVYSLSGDSPALSIYSDGTSKWFIY
tara:strand:- start:2294 stop:2905 length:612 start_codon:yes stop_codon:yes gene_type:complete